MGSATRMRCVVLASTLLALAGTAHAQETDVEDGVAEASPEGFSSEGGESGKPTAESPGGEASSGGDRDAEDSDPEAPDSSAEDEVADPGKPTEGVEEIVVTGEKMTEVIDQAVFATEFSGVELTRLRAQDLRDLAAYTPNLEIKTTFASSNPVIFIRGVGLDDFNANAAGSVAVYYDDVQINSPAGQLGQMFDVKSVAVLNGPQGVYGRNASAGAIHVITRKPTGEAAVDGTFTYANFNTIESVGAVEVPIFDELAFRAAYRLNQGGGHVKNHCGGLPASPRKTQDMPDALGASVCGGDVRSPLPAGLESKLADLDNWAVRGALRWQPDSMDWLLNVHGGKHRDDALAFQGVGARPKFGKFDGQGYRDDDGDPFEGEYNRTGLEKLDLFGTYLRGDLSLGDYSLKSVSGYEWNDRQIDEDTDASPNILIESLFRDSAWQVSQELRLTSDDSTNLHWETGGLYFMEKLTSNNVFDIGGPSFFEQDFEQDTWSFAFFGQFIWDLSETFMVEGGIRYNWERKSFNLLSRRANDQNPLEFEAKNESVSDTWSAPTGQISLIWRPTEDVDLFVKYTRGFKTGHFNAGAILEKQLVTAADPEYIDSYEIGIKSHWFDSRLRIDLNAFFYDYQDLQVFIIENGDGANPVQQLINANDARNFGVDLRIEARPFEGIFGTRGFLSEVFEGFSVNASFGWLESEYLDFTNQFFARVGVRPNIQLIEVPVNFSGNRLTSSPRFQASAIVDWRIPIMPEGRYGWVVPGYDFSFKDKVFFDPTEGQGIDPTKEFPPLALGQKPYWLHNFQLAWRSPEQQFEIAGWVRNAFDKKYRLNAFDLSQNFQKILYVWGKPRTYGMTVSVNFSVEDFF